MELQEVSFAYDGDERPVWQGLSCYFEPGEINLLLGPSGCGKSTLLFLLNGLIPSFYEGELTGRVLLRGVDITGKSPQERSSSVGMVFQDPDAQFCAFTVEEELAFGLENIGTDPAQMKDAISRALEQTGLQGQERTPLSALSGGQKQRVAIASVLMTGADILLLDEPTANLDAASRSEVFALLRRLTQELGKTVILVEHNLDGLLESAGHIVVLDEHGALSLQGSGADVVRALVFDRAHQRRNVYLPEYLLAVRAGLAASDEESLRAFCEKQAACIGDGTRYFRFPIDAFAQLIAPLAEPREPMAPDSCSAEPLLCIKALSYTYGSAQKRRKPAADGGAPTLRDATLNVARGEFLALVGPNGAGKSTLLHVLFRVLEGYGGHIALEGRELAAIPKQALYSALGLVFQNPESQFATNVVRDELRFSLKSLSLSEQEQEARANAMLERFQLSEEADKSPFLLSQGQKRRLSVATMLLTGQKTLVLDEPTYGQDYENREALMQLLQTLNREGVTVIVVTHDMALVAEYADRVAVLCEGEIAFTGDPHALFAEPDLLRRARLALPDTARFTAQLRERVPAVPRMLSRAELVRYLSGLTEGRGA